MTSPEPRQKDAPALPSESHSQSEPSQKGTAADHAGSTEEASTTALVLLPSGIEVFDFGVWSLDIRRPGRRRIRLAILAVAALLAFWACADLLYVTVDAEADRSAPASAILVLGCKAYENGGPTPCIRTRAAHAAE